MFTLTFIDFFPPESNAMANYIVTLIPKVVYRTVNKSNFMNQEVLMILNTGGLK